MDNISTNNNNNQIKHSEPKYINQNDFIYFKNELLKDLKSIESKILSKVNTSQEDFHTKIININSKVTALNTKIFELSSNMSSEKSDTEKLNKFKNEFTQYFDKTSSLFYYLYTELFLMVDSRAKNAMVCYYHSRTPGDGGNK